MAGALNWNHIRIHFARRHALQNVDEPHIVPSRMNHFPRPIGANGRDAAKVQSIRLHRPNSRVEIFVRPVDHWLGLVVTVPGIVLVPSSFVVVETVPVKEIGKCGLEILIV